MAVIMGYMGDDKYYLAADNEITHNGTPVAVGEDLYKIREYPHFMIGITGRAKNHTALNGWKPPRRGRKEPLDTYIKNKIVPSLEQRLIDCKIIGEENKIPDYDNNWGTFLLACDDGLYIIGHDMCCYKLKANYYAIGCGGEVAIGALGMASFLPGDFTDKQKLHIACELAAEYCDGVNNDFQVIERSYKK